MTVKQFITQTAGVHVVNRQRLSLSAQMRQKLHLLSMPCSDLNRFVTGEMERNPLLATLPHQGGSGQDFSVLELIDKKSAHQSPTLQEHLREQIIFSFTNKKDRHIAFTLSAELNESGYFEGDLAAMAGELGVHPEYVDTIFSKLQTFDPPGLFARSLAECLHLQLERQKLFDPIFAKILQSLSMLAQRDFAQMVRFCAITREEMMRRLALIKKLDPKPGLKFAAPRSDENPVIIADAFIDCQQQEGWHVSLNDAVLPKLIIDKNYHQMIGGPKEERQFIKNWTAEAHWLIRALDARAQTLLQVISAIIEVQKDFLQAGSTELKPLTLAQIAKATHLHESTISRTIAHKYVTIRKNDRVSGIYDLRYFFSGKLGNRTGKEPHASRAIEARIGQLIAAEEVPLSDAALAQLLTSQGVAIARRTIAKYRERLQIAPAHQRKRERRHLNSFN